MSRNCLFISPKESCPGASRCDHRDALMLFSSSFFCSSPPLLHLTSPLLCILCCLARTGWWLDGANLDGRSPYPDHDHEIPFVLPHIWLLVAYSCGSVFCNSYGRRGRHLGLLLQAERSRLLAQGGFWVCGWLHNHNFYRFIFSRCSCSCRWINPILVLGWRCDAEQYRSAGHFSARR